MKLFLNPTIVAALIGAVALIFQSYIQKLETDIQDRMIQELLRENEKIRSDLKISERNFESILDKYENSLGNKDTKLSYTKNNTQPEEEKIKKKIEMCENLAKEVTKDSLKDTALSALMPLISTYYFIKYISDPRLKKFLKECVK